MKIPSLTFALLSILLLLLNVIPASWLVDFRSVTLTQAIGMAQSSELVAISRSANCIPGSGWVWMKGPDRPEIADQARKALAQMGIQAVVNAGEYGERDSCGNFYLYAIDFSVTVQNGPTEGSLQQSTIGRIYSVLTKLGQPRVGNVRMTLMPENVTFTIPADMTFSDGMVTHGIFPETPTVAAQDGALSPRAFLPLVTRSYPQEVLRRNVYVIVYDPILSNGQYLSDYLGWNDHSALTQGTIEFFRQVTNNRLQYNVVYTTIVTDGWPAKIDRFRYTEAEYLAVINGQRPPHSPDTVDYNAIVNSSALDICGKANRGEIDEVWIYNGPYFGFYESTLVGPGAYWYNSPPVPGPHNCQRLIPIMGPSPERGLDCAVHNFGHRMEAAMTRVYGSWQQNRTAHNWERFALVKALSPDYSYSGCGNIHYPPNGQSDYDYYNSSYTPSNCDDFFNYPNLGAPTFTAKPTNCSSWNCTDLDYLAYWFRHTPSASGCGPDGKANNWWKYFVDPALALNPSGVCP